MLTVLRNFHTGLVLTADMERIVTELIATKLESYIIFLVRQWSGHRLEIMCINRLPIHTIETCTYMKITGTLKNAEFNVSQIHVHQRLLFVITRCIPELLYSIFACSVPCTDFDVLCERISRPNYIGNQYVHTMYLPCPFFSAWMDFNVPRSGPFFSYVGPGEYLCIPLEMVLEYMPYKFNVPPFQMRERSRFKVILVEEHIVTLRCMFNMERTILQYAICEPTIFHTDVLFEDTTYLVPRTRTEPIMLSHTCLLPATLDFPVATLSIVQKNAIIRMLDCTILQSLCGAVYDIQDRKRILLFSIHTTRTTEITEDMFHLLTQIQGCILALATGMGKTVVVLCVATLLCGTSLILVPPTLITHWEAEARKYNIQQISFIKCQKEVRQYLPTRITVMNRDLLQRNITAFSVVENVFIDEAHTFDVRTKAFRAFKTIRKQRVFPITATPATNYHTLKEMIHTNLNLAISRYSSEEVFLYRHVLKCEHPVRGFVSVDISTCLLPQPPSMIRIHSKLQGIICRRQLVGKRMLRLFERVVAGGILDIELLGAIIDRLFETVQESNVHIAATLSPLEPFLTDTCPICLDLLTTPIQTECRHVFCLICIRALCDIRARCPLCRYEFGTNITVWPLTEQSCRTDQETITALLTGPGTSQSSVLDEKRIAFEKYLQTYGHRGPLVLFSKRICTAAAYVEICHRYGKRVVTAGMTLSRKESCAHIELFRQGGADVLLCDFMYSTGFDLCNAAHLVILDVDLRLENIIQSIGRLTRLGQVFSTVYVTVLLYENGFDHFLFSIRNSIGKSFENTLSNMLQLERFCTVHIEGSRMFRIDHFMRHIVEPWLQERQTTDTAQILLLNTSSKQMIYRDTYSYPRVHFWKINIQTSNDDVWISCSRKEGSYALRDIQEIPSICSTIWS